MKATCSGLVANWACSLHPGVTQQTDDLSLSSARTGVDKPTELHLNPLSNDTLSGTDGLLGSQCERTRIMCTRAEGSNVHHQCVPLPESPLLPPCGHLNHIFSRESTAGLLTGFLCAQVCAETHSKDSSAEQDCMLNGGVFSFSPSFYK